MKQKRILIVEDDPVLVEMYKEKLKNSGFKVSSVMDGKRAAYRIAKEHADLILLDILMPNMNGFEILKKVKADDLTKKVPVIVLTNVGSQSIDRDKELAISLGASDYMIKSLNTPESVVKRVRQLLDM